VQQVGVIAVTVIVVDGLELADLLEIVPTVV